MRCDISENINNVDILRSDPIINLLFETGELTLDTLEYLNLLHNSYPFTTSTKPPFLEDPIFGSLLYRVQEFSNTKMESSPTMNKFTNAFAVFTVLLSFGAISDLQSAELAELKGNWSGTWRSDISEHEGPLKAKFEVKSDEQVEARFSGRFFKVIPFKFIVILDVVSSGNGVIKLKGKQDLGRTLGTYHYDVTFKENEFVAKYHTDKDKGVFQVSKK